MEQNEEPPSVNSPDDGNGNDNQHVDLDLFVYWQRHVSLLLNPSRVFVVGNKRLA